MELRILELLLATQMHQLCVQARMSKSVDMPREEAIRYADEHPATEFLPEVVDRIEQMRIALMEELAKRAP